MASFDLTGPIRTMRGEAVKQPSPGSKPDASGQFAESDLIDRTLGELAAEVLVAEQRDRHADGLTKLRRYKLALRIMDAREPVELSAAEITEILDQAAMHAVTFAYGQLALALGEGGEH